MNQKFESKRESTTETHFGKHASRRYLLVTNLGCRPVALENSDSFTGII